MIRTLRERVPNIGQAVISVHCHNDLGLAVANSLAACEVGARQVECTINGIGERAGNAALEEIVMALKTRSDYYGLTTGIKTERLYPVSRMVSTITGLTVQRNKAIVGRNAFAHEAGIHQDGMLKERSTYEIMRPEEVGVPKTDLVLGKHSGRHALRDRVIELGYHLNDAQLETLFDDFKALADKKKEVYDEDLVVLIEKHIQDVPAHWSLVSLHTTAGTERDCRRPPSASAAPTARSSRTPRSATARSTPSSRRSSGSPGSRPTSASSPSGASPPARTRRARSRSSWRSRATTARFRGRAASTDIIEASAEAYLNAVNAIATRRERDQPREVIGRAPARRGVTSSCHNSHLFWYESCVVLLPGPEPDRARPHCLQ